MATTEHDVTDGRTDGQRTTIVDMMARCWHEALKDDELLEPVFFFAMPARGTNESTHAASKTFDEMHVHESIGTSVIIITIYIYIHIYI